MFKHAFTLSAVLTTTIATVLVVVRCVEYACDLPALLQPSIEEQAVEERLTKYWCFKRTLESTQRALDSGDIRLKDAYPQVVEAARRYCPVYLSKLGIVELGVTDEERVARNLFRYLHFEAINSDRPPTAAQLAALDIELAALLCEMHKRSMRGSASP